WGAPKRVRTDITASLLSLVILGGWAATEFGRMGWLQLSARVWGPPKDAQAGRRRRPLRNQGISGPRWHGDGLPGLRSSARAHRRAENHPRARPRGAVLSTSGRRSPVAHLADGCIVGNRVFGQALP